MSEEFYTKLIYKSLVGDLSVADQELLDSWLLDAKNAKYASEIRLSWTLADEYGSISNLDMDREFAAIQTKIGGEKNAEKPKARIVRRRWMAIAAVALVLITVGFFWRSSTISIEWDTIVGSRPSNYAQLEDGSEVWLSEGSSLTFPKSFKKNIREVQMTGSVLFKVKHHENLPFVVNTRNELIKVLGTQFHVDETQERSSIQLLEGKIRVDHLDGTFMAELEPGQRLLNDFSEGTFVVEDQLLENEFAWQSNKLVFRSLPLLQALEVIGNHFDVELVLSNEDLNTCLFSATFEASQIDGIISTITEVFNLEVTQSADTYYLNGGTCQLDLD